MGLRGPKPQPTKIIQMRGSWRAKNRHGEPVVEMGKPPCPDYLDVEEKKVWRKLITQLDKAGVLAKIDGDVLGRYCVLRSRWLAAVAFVKIHGDTYEVKDGTGRVVSTQAYPQAWMVSKYHSDLVRIESSFGLSPSARASLGLATGRQGETTDRDISRFFDD